MGVPCRRAKAWTASTVKQVVTRNAPALLPPPTTQVRVSSAFRLSGLLRCGCGVMLTGRTHRGKFTAYSCRKSATDPWHSKPHSISEDRVLPWVEREMGRDLRGDPREVNALLRKWLAVIELDTYLMPVRGLLAAERARQDGAASMGDSTTTEGLDAIALVNYGGRLGNARLGGYNPAPW